MILDCPSCSSRFLLPPGSIPADGRDVRCGKCGHVWHQTPPEANTGLADPFTQDDAKADTEDALDFKKIMDDMDKSEEASRPPPPIPNAIRPKPEDQQRIDIKAKPAKPGASQRLRPLLPHAVSVAMAAVAAGILLGGLYWAKNQFLGEKVQALMFEKIKVTRDADSLSVEGKITNITGKPVTLPSIVLIAETESGEVVGEWVQEIPGATEIGPERALDLNFTVTGKIEKAARLRVRTGEAGSKAVEVEKTDDHAEKSDAHAPEEKAHEDAPAAHH